MIAEAVVVTATWLATHSTRLKACKEAVETAITSKDWAWNTASDDVSILVNDTITSVDTEVTYELTCESITVPTNISSGTTNCTVVLTLGDVTENCSATATLNKVPASEWAFTCTVIGSNAEVSGAGKYKGGATVNLDAGTAIGKTFKSWTIDPSVTFTDGNGDSNAVTAFTMPLSDITATATWNDIDYTITMDESCDTAKGPDATYNYGETVTVKCTNADFVEWSCDDPTVVFTDKTLAETTFTMPAKNITIDHSFKSYTVNITGEFATTGAGSYLAGQTVTVKTDAVPEYTFNGWTSTDVTFTAVNDLESTFVMPSKDVNVSATWTRIVYDVTVTLMDLKSSGYESIGEIIVIDNASGDSVELDMLPGNHLDGYKFIECVPATDNLPAEDLGQTPAFTMPSGNVTLNYRRNPQLTLEINGVNGSETSERKIQYTGDVVQLNAGVKTGATFGSWVVEPAGSATIANANDAATSITMIDQGIKVSVVWNMIPYSITVDDACNSVSKKDNVHCGETITVTCNSAEFVEWSCSDPSVVFADKTAVSTTFKMPAGNISIDHSFKTYELTLSANCSDHNIDDSTGLTGAGSYKAGDSVTINAGTNLHHDLTGWWIDTPVDGFDFNEGGSEPARTFTMPASNLSLRADWILSEAELIVSSNLPANQNGSGWYRQNQSVTIKAGDPVSGKMFAGWKCDTNNVSIETGGNDKDFTFNMPTTEVRFTATWKDLYTVTVTGSTLPNDQNGSGQYAPGTTVTVKAGTPAAGMKFVGWECPSNNVTPI